MTTVTMVGLLAGAAAGSAALVLRGLAALRAARDRERLADAEVLAPLVGQPPLAIEIVRALFLAAGAGGLAAALFAIGAELDAQRQAEGQETVLVLDASNSMWARDAEPSRLGRQQELAATLASRLPGKIGVVYFAGRGYVLSPLTKDRDAVLMFVASVDPAVVGQGGTSLASGLRQGLDVLAGGEPGARRAIILFTDGETTTPGDEEAAAEIAQPTSRAARLGIPVYPVGLGTPEGATIPLPPGSDETGAQSGSRQQDGAEDGSPEQERLLRDAEGRPVLSRLEERLLRVIARRTGGAYVPGTSAGVEALLRRLGDGRSEVGAAGREPGAATWLLLLAFGSLFAEAYLFRRG